jgi:hypothetical protein
MFPMTSLLGRTGGSRHACCAMQHPACVVQALCGVEGVTGWTIGIGFLDTGHAVQETADTVGEFKSAEMGVPQLGRDKARYLMVRLLIPPAEPDWRLSPHPALPLWSISENNARSVPSHFLNSMDVHPWTACAFAQYLCSGLSKG